MHLRSITLKGFKSFPTRTRLEFGPGVSVIVGPNGSGKSNVTDAVLWALGEQSPLAVRGQSMKDVIFAGGHGVQGARAAEVEVVIDNEASGASLGEGRLDSGFAEISIVRRLGRDGEGEYRLNGARCRLVDVIDVLSDSGLGKEMHSVVSQGKVEQIVLSRPRERRLLIEEAAGLGKHRKRRRRAQLKLERTEENLARALDVEREARSRLRPLKRQAEAAELHERLERQTLEARLALTGDAARTARAALAAAEAKSSSARAERDEAERLLAAVARRREEAEEAFAAGTRERERLQGRLFASRSAAERVVLRLERVREQGAAAGERRARRLNQLEVLEKVATEAGTSAGEERPEGRIAAIERELAELDASRDERLARELAGLERELQAAKAQRAELDRAAAERRRALDAAEQSAERARAERRAAQRAAEAARARSAEIGAELAVANRLAHGAAASVAGTRPLAEGLDVDRGYELAVAAVLGPRLTAGVVRDRGAGDELLDRAGRDGGGVLIEGAPAAEEVDGAPPAGAESLLDRVRAEPSVAPVVARLLRGVWVVESLASLPEDFGGLAVTRSGRVFDAARGELSQAPAGGADRLLVEIRRRDELVAAAEEAAGVEVDATRALEKAAAIVREADAARDAAESSLRAVMREVAEAEERAGRSEWILARRRAAPDDGPEAVRRAELLGDLRAERRLAERIEAERAGRERAMASLRRGAEDDRRAAAGAARAARALEAAHAALTTRRDALQAELDAGAAAGEETAARLRACAHEEAQLQGRLKRASDALTAAEVEAQHERDAVADVERDLQAIAGRLGLEAEATDEPLGPEEREALEARVERLERRREQLGPVNPLAKREYEDAVRHVEELEAQRQDLEDALSELESLIKETDRRIREAFEETFAAAAENFEDVVQHLFPGGRGRLRLVHAEQGPRPVIGGEPPTGEGAEPAQDEEQPDAGVEIEVAPPGKSTKRLSLLSGGEKSLVALAFMFAVFLARPCPFYILDEVEAALDDINIDRFLELVKRYSDRAQFIVVTHQKRTMDAADTLYGVSMGGDGVSRVVSRRLGGRAVAERAA
jgi:chromosome segregation protein